MPQNKNYINRIDFYLICLVIIISSVLFYYGYFIDASKPVSGLGWADQSYYLKVAKKIANGEELIQSDFHYQINYSLFGSFFIIMGLDHPFAAVSFIFLIFSVIFLYLGARFLFDVKLTLLFLLLIFYFSGDVRLLDSATKIFFVPWNNQVIFFAVSVFYFLFMKKAFSNACKLASDWRGNFKLLFFVIPFITGFTVGAREESAILLIPLIIYIYRSYKAPLKWQFMGFAIILIAYSPNLYFKYMVFNELFINVRPGDGAKSYYDKLLAYNDGLRFIQNLQGLIFNSSLTGEDPAGRLALLQSNPFFYLSLPGIIVLLVHAYQGLKGLGNHGCKMIICVYLISVVLMAIFYLSGENMSVYKLRFHCLRYISFVWIPLSFFVVYLILFILDFRKITLSD